MMFVLVVLAGIKSDARTPLRRSGAELQSAGASPAR